MALYQFLCMALTNMRWYDVIRSAKLWIALTLSSLMSFGALASDAHMADVPEVWCEEGDVWESESPASSFAIAALNVQTDQRVHNHHRHSCGSCHIHVVSPMDAETDFASVDTLKFSFGPNLAAPRAGPHDLFRPPRV